VRVRQLALGTAVATAMLLATSACGGEPEEGPLDAKGGDATSAPSPSESAQAAATKPDVPASPRNTSAGRIAFAKYFVKAYNYAYATNDATPITAVGSTAQGTECQMCEDLAKYVEGQKAKGLHLEPADLPVKRVFETARAAENVWVIDIQSSAPKRADVDAAGNAVKTYPAKKDYLIEVGVAWENGHYRVTGWKSGEN
jgi:uncharacterized protein DUF6318